MINAHAPIVHLLSSPEFVESLTPAELAVLVYDAPDIWLEERQRVPRHAWQTFGFVGGRGLGKTFANATECIRAVRAGEIRHLGLMGPTEKATIDLQVLGPCGLLALSPPWFPATFVNERVEWPNGATAHVFTAESPKGPRGFNLERAWATELVAWPENTRDEAWTNLNTATRNTNSRRIVWDTTSKGKNNLIKKLLDDFARDPVTYPYRTGTIFDNPWYGPGYLRAQWESYSGRRREEELFGRVFDESEGALWQQTWIDLNRRLMAPIKMDLEIVAIDPAISQHASADLTGIVRAGVLDKHIFLTHDNSGKYDPALWCDIAIDHCINGCTGIVLERNKGGDAHVTNLRERAERKAIVIRMIEDDAKPFPPRTPGVAYVKQIKTMDPKETRAYAPAALSEAGRVHHVGTFDELETEMTSWVPGDKSHSPNRLDAAVYAILELSNLTREKPVIDPSEKVRQTVEVGRELNRRLQIAHAQRKIGFL